MKKFTKLNESHNSVEKSTNVDELLFNLIKETLGENKNTPILVELLTKFIDIQTSKKVVSVLEMVKNKSYRHFDMNWINSLIEEGKSNYELLEDELNEKEQLDISVDVTIHNKNKDLDVKLVDNSEEEIDDDDDEIDEFEDDDDLDIEDDEIEKYKDFETNESLTEDETYIDGAKVVYHGFDKDEIEEDEEIDLDEEEIEDDEIIESYRDDKNKKSKIFRFDEFNK